MVFAEKGHFFLTTKFPKSNRDEFVFIDTANQLPVIEGGWYIADSDLLKQWLCPAYVDRKQPISLRAAFAD